MRTSAPRYRVVCDDYRNGPEHRTMAAAERRLADITRAGHCRLPHRIIQVR